MAFIETEALILKTYSLSDADKIVVFLSQTRGLVRGVAKGAKRLKSKFGGSLEPFSIVQLTYIEKEERELVAIEQVEIKKSFFAEASEPDFLQRFSYLTELLVQFAPPNEPNETLYKMSTACLSTVVDFDGGLEAIEFYFEFWVLRLGGYLPDWSACRNCRRDFVESDVARLQNDFDLLCANCDDSLKNKAITSASRYLFSRPQRISPQAFVEQIGDRTHELHDLSQMVKRIISRVLDREVKSSRPFVVAPRV